MGASEVSRLKKKYGGKRPPSLLRALEQRFLFDAAAIIDPLALLDPSATNTSADKTVQTTSSTTSATSTPTPTSDTGSTNSTKDTSSQQAGTSDTTKAATSDSAISADASRAASAMFVPPSTVSAELQAALQKASDTLRQLPTTGIVPASSPIRAETRGTVCRGSSWIQACHPRAAPAAMFSERSSR